MDKFPYKCFLFEAHCRKKEKRIHKFPYIQHFYKVHYRKRRVESTNFRICIFFMKFITEKGENPPQVSVYRSSE